MNPRDDSRYAKSAEMAAQRRAVMVGGVNGDGRTDQPFPIVFRAAAGATLTDVDDNQYLDLHGGYGTAVLGYSHPGVDGAVRTLSSNAGTFVGVANPWEADLAVRLCELLPEAERIALCGGGGSDALYHAIRVARAHTGRARIIKVEGGYHGWHGDLGVSTRPDPSRLGHEPDSNWPLPDDPAPPSVPNSAGILSAVSDAVSVVPANDADALESRVQELGDELAAIVVEPVLYSAGTIAVDAKYLRTAAELAAGSGALLVFDEVLSGFRCRLGGAGQLAGVTPDLAAYGKSIANGHVLAFLAGRADLLETLSPMGPAFYSGTFNGHPAGVAAAMATLDELSRPGFYEGLLAGTEQVCDAVRTDIEQLGLNVACQSVGSGFTIYFGTRSVRSYRDLVRSLSPEVETLNATFRWWLRDRGVFMQRRAGTNRCFIGGAHTGAQLDQIATTIVAFLREHVAELALDNAGLSAKMSTT